MIIIFTKSREIITNMVCVN